MSAVDDDRPSPDAGPGAIRELPDDTLLVFLSDTHMGGDEGVDLFEAHAELAALFNELAAIPTPVELILAGDVFDLLRVGNVPSGENRVSATLRRPEYASLVSAWQTFAAGPGHRVTYLPGNHDVEVWWNADIQRSLRETGLVHAFSLSYAAHFRSAEGRLIYCEHGNQLDTANARQDYGDPADTPLGDHVVTELIRPISARLARADEVGFRDLARVHPLSLIPEWLAGRLFYRLVDGAVRFVILPILLGYALAVAAIFAAGRLSGQTINIPAFDGLIIVIAYSAVLLAVVFAILFFVGRRAARRAVAYVAPDVAALDEERASLERVMILKGSEALVPLHPTIRYTDLQVFVWGHSHAPSLTMIERSGDTGVAANCGCWLRQIRPVRAHFRAPAVFISRFVMSHVRIRLAGEHLRVELWEQRRPVAQRLRAVESLAIIGRDVTSRADGASRPVSVAELSARRPFVGRQIPAQEPD